MTEITTNMVRLEIPVPVDLAEDLIDLAEKRKELTRVLCREILAAYVKEAKNGN
jgi:hypothetical protein